MEMNTYARIQNGTVAELLRTSQSIADLFHPGLAWVEVSDYPDVIPGWTFDGQHFSKPIVTPSPPALPTMAGLAAELAALKVEVTALRTHAASTAKQG